MKPMDFLGNALNGTLKKTDSSKILICIGDKLSIEVKAIARNLESSFCFFVVRARLFFGYTVISLTFFKKFDIITT